MACTICDDICKQGIVSESDYRFYVLALLCMLLKRESGEVGVEYPDLVEIPFGDVEATPTPVGILAPGEQSISYTIKNFTDATLYGGFEGVTGAKFKLEPSEIQIFNYGDSERYELRDLTIWHDGGAPTTGEVVIQGIINA